MRLSNDVGSRVMKLLLCLVVMVGMQAICLGEGQAVPFYAQLIRGTDAEKPGKISWRPVGPKLSKQFGPKFRWKRYWEVNRQAVSVIPGKPTRIRLSAEREIEIELRGGAEYDIRLYTAGKLARSSRQKLESRMSIMGGGIEATESWFIVVRRDPPTVE